VARGGRRGAAAWASAIAFVVVVVGACTDRDGAGRDVVQERVRSALETGDDVPVIVSFRDPEPDLLRADRTGHRRLLRAAGESLLARHPDGFVPLRRFEHVPAVAGRLSRRALDGLARDPNVSFIQVDGGGEGALAVAVPAIGGDVAKTQFRVTGKGVRMAVLDTGVNTNHPDLRSSVVATQHCFTRNACPPGNTSEGTSAEDDHGHGSHVSGIVTSDGQVAGSGFAPDVEIVAVKINDRNDSGWESDWVAGLDWVFANLATLNVKVVNMSICTNQLYTAGGSCDANQPALARAVKNLVDAGVTLFAASGNRGSSSQLSAPACNTGVIAVGATYKSNQGRQPQSGTFQDMWGQSFGACADATSAFDKVACFTNSNARLDIVAPGAVIVSDSLGTQTEQYRGTSQSSPTAAGVAALMLECNPSLTPAEIKSILIRTAVYVTDAKNGLEFPSIRADAAVREACAGRADGGTNDASANGRRRDGRRRDGRRRTGRERWRWRSGRPGWRRRPRRCRRWRRCGRRGGWLWR
jgi:subtilisin family serine protease